MADPAPNVRLNLAGTPENVVLVREMLSGVGQALGLELTELNDIRTAVTEACNNVVVHAYGEEDGPLDVEVRVKIRSLDVLVRDHGVGIQSRSDVSDASAAGIGLHVIRTLARDVSFSDTTDGGTQVEMVFATSNTTALDSSQGGDMAALRALASAGLQTNRTTLTITPISLARTVLPRIVSTLAARAHFSTDRISDAQLLADAVATHAQTTVSGDQLSIDVDIEPRDLELRIAPLGSGRARRLIGDSELDGLGSIIEKLADRRGVASAGPYETLTLGLIDRR